jgi:5-methylcytosine-specific restriction endonuclease McrA
VAAHGTISGYCKSQCRCEKCHAAWTAYYRAWRVRNAEKVRADKAAYYRENKERIAESVQRWRAANKEKVRAYGRASRVRWRAANPEKSRAESKAWRLANYEKSRAAEKAYKQRNRAKFTAYQQRRDALKAGAAGARYTTEVHIAARWAMWGDLCRYCGAPATATDHRIPLSRGGSHWPSNLVPVCMSCNSSKFTHTEPEFLAIRERVAA